MTEVIFPAKLQPGDEVRVIAPSCSHAIISSQIRKFADERFKELDLRLSFSTHCEESDDFRSSSIESRVADLHEAFADPAVKAIITTIGGFNSNQLLSYIDWDMIKSHPKVFCGYSDITALNNAMLARAHLVTYSGPHYSTLGQELYLDYTLEYFKRCLFTDDPIELRPSREWSDDAWYKDQQDRHLIQNSGYLVIHAGDVSGQIVGANLCTFNLLHGTQFMPSLEGTVLFIEDDSDSSPVTFDRDLQSLIHQSGFVGVKGLVIGRFQQASKITDDLLRRIIDSKHELKDVPVVANVDFGHTDPKITFPIGGTVCLKATSTDATITIVQH